MCPEFCPDCGTPMNIKTANTQTNTLGWVCRYCGKTTETIAPGEMNVPNEIGKKQTTNSLASSAPLS